MSEKNSGNNCSEPAVFSEQAERRVEEIKKLYPDPRSAIMPVMYIAQEELGSITAAAIQWIAEKVGVPPVQVMEVATFYTMYYQKPVGKYHFQVCRTLSCALRGAREISECLQRRLGLNPGQVSKDGLWSYEEVECLGSCGSAPMCEINDTYFENLTPQKVLELIDRIEHENPDLRFSTIKDMLGAGLKGEPKSRVL